MSGACEWNPMMRRAAYTDEPSHAVAVYRVGNLHLCASCADLPLFKRFKKRPLVATPPGVPARAAGPAPGGDGR